MFEIKRAVFDPTQVAALKAATDRALAVLAPAGSLEPETEKRLCRVVVHLARDRLAENIAIGDELGREAAAFISGLRSRALLP